MEDSPGHSHRAPADERDALVAAGQKARQTHTLAEQAVIDAAVDVASRATEANLATLRKAVADLEAANDRAIRANEQARAAYEGRRIF